jgi:hypothetical protein
MDTRDRAGPRGTLSTPEREARRREAEQARNIALPVGAALLALAIVLLFVVNTAWPLALAVVVIDAVFLGLVAWHYRHDI